MNKIFLNTMLLLIFVFGSIILIAFKANESIKENYWIEFNDFRKERGLYSLGPSKDTIEENWGTFLPNNQLWKWQWILSNEEIATQTVFIYDSSETKAYHQSKTIYYGTFMFFWKNFYGGEIDIFVNPISPDTLLELKQVYYSESIEPRDYLYTNIDTIVLYEPLLIRCGGVDVIDMEVIPKGNITNKQADMILEEWGL